ncbi:hypothetical protein N599_22315 [Saccharopolyspora erythraea D]|nr:hypothetical protein N599_22315 [Saccharopolyspora erythraea D]
MPCALKYSPTGSVVTIGPTTSAMPSVTVSIGGHSRRTRLAAKRAGCGSRIQLSVIWKPLMAKNPMSTPSSGCTGHSGGNSSPVPTSGELCP